MALVRAIPEALLLEQQDGGIIVPIGQQVTSSTGLRRRPLLAGTQAIPLADTSTQKSLSGPQQTLHPLSPLFNTRYSSQAGQDIPGNGSQEFGMNEQGPIRSDNIGRQDASVLHDTRDQAFAPEMDSQSLTNGGHYSTEQQQPFGEGEDGARAGSLELQKERARLNTQFAPPAFLSDPQPIHEQEPDGEEMDAQRKQYEAYKKNLRGEQGGRQLQRTQRKMQGGKKSGSPLANKKTWNLAKAGGSETVIIALLLMNVQLMNKIWPKSHVPLNVGGYVNGGTGSTCRIPYFLGLALQVSYRGPMYAVYSAVHVW